MTAKGELRTDVNQFDPSVSICSYLDSFQLKNESVDTERSSVFVCSTFLF